MERKRALLIDDDPDINQMYRDVLKDIEVEVDCTLSALEALVLVDAKSYDLIITDLEMPTLSGAQFISCLRVSKRNRSTPVITISGCLDKYIKRLDELQILKNFEKGGTTDEVQSYVKQLFSPKVHKPIGYDSDVVQMFRDTARNLFAFYLTEQEVRVLPLEIRTGKSISNGYCSSVVCLFGRQVYGSVSITLDLKLLTTLGMRLFNLPEEDVDPMDFLDFTGEMANQFAGQLKLALKERDYHTIIGLPHLISGHDHRIPRHVTNPTACISVEAGGGRGWVEFCLGDPKQLNSTREEPEARILVYDEK